VTHKYFVKLLTVVGVLQVCVSDVIVSVNC